MTKMNRLYESSLHFFKQTVHPGNSQNKHLLFEPCYIMFHSHVSAFVCTFSCLKKCTEKANVGKHLFSKWLGYTIRLKEV